MTPILGHFAVRSALSASSDKAKISTGLGSGEPLVFAKSVSSRVV